MAAMTTALTEFSDNGNSRTYVTSTHTAEKPRLVLQKRRTATGGSSTISDTIDVVHATVDSEGKVLDSKVGFSVTVRRPLNGQNSDVLAALAIFRDIIAGDEFGTMVDTQKFLS